MMSVAGDILSDYTEEDVQQRVSGLYDNELNILSLAQGNNRSPFEIVNELARSKIYDCL